MVTFREIARTTLLLAVGLLSMGQMCVNPVGQSTDQGGDQSPQTQPAAWEEFVGGNDQRLIFRRVTSEPEYVAFDVASGQAAPVQAADTTDGRWLVSWQDGSETLDARDLDTGTESQFSILIAGQPFVPYSVHSSRLYGALSRGSQQMLAILDLTTGEATIVPDNVEPYSGFNAAEGDWFAILYYPPTNLGDPPPMLSVDDPAAADLFNASIDAINLKTHERKPIMSGTPNGLWGVVGHRVIWGDWTYDATTVTATTTVRAYDLDTDRTDNLLEVLSTPSDNRSVSSVGESGILVSYWQAMGDSGTEKQGYELHTFDGQVQTVLEAVLDQSQSQSLRMSGFAGRRLVYQEPSADIDNWTLYDPADGNRRVITPFTP